MGIIKKTEKKEQPFMLQAEDLRTLFYHLNKHPHERTLSYSTRSSLLKDLRRQIEADESSILQAISSDLGKTPYEAYLTELLPIYTELNQFKRKLKRWLKPKSVGFSLLHFGSKSYTVLEPLGTVLIYAPWNYPFHLCIIPLIAAIAAGNRVILSPSPSAPATASIVKEVLRKVFPEDILYCLEPNTFDADDLLKLPFDHIFYTGGPGYAHTIADAAAKHLTPTTLELGGKSPCIISDGADLKLASKRVAWAKLLNSGQTCVAPDYLLVQESILEQFLQLLKEAIALQMEYISGDRNGYLPLIRPQKVEQLSEAIMGLDIIFGGKVSAEGDAMQPTLVMNPPTDTLLMTQEIFAPVLPIIPYSELSTAISYICFRPKPLALYIFGNEEAFKEVEQSTTSGSIVQNDCIMQLSHPSLPFGGVGDSGMGRYHGKSGLYTFSNLKSVLRSSKKVDPALRYKLRGDIGVLKKITKWLFP